MKELAFLVLIGITLGGLNIQDNSLEFTGHNWHKCNKYVRRLQYGPVNYEEQIVSLVNAGL